MTVGELKQLLEDQEIPDDHRLTIRFIGGMGSSTVDIESAYRGFDWTNNQLVLNPELAMVIEEWYRTLKKGSGHDASHVGMLMKSVEAVLKQHDTDDGFIEDALTLNGLLADLQKSLDRLARFQKQGF